MPTVGQFIVWMIVGLIGGTLAGLLVTWRRQGFGFLSNLGLGLIGALLGGAIFRVFRLFPRLDEISISLRDVVAACLGSLVVVAALWIWRWFHARASAEDRLHPGRGAPTEVP